LAHFAHVLKDMSSNVNSALALGHKLRDAGHRVTYLSVANLGRRMKVEGFDFVPLSRDLGGQRPESGGGRNRNLVAKVRDRHRARRASLSGRELIGHLERLSPDGLLIDLEMHYAVIVAAGLGIPTALVIGWFTVFRHPHLPPLHTDLMPDGTTESARSIEAAWDRLVHSKRRARLRRYWQIDRWRRAGRPLRYQTLELADLRALARVHGFDFGREVDLDGWLIPMSYRRLPLLSYTAREMEFPHEPHPLMHYLGPMASPGRTEAAVDDARVDIWRRFADTRGHGVSARRPLIYCSLGTFWSTDVAFLRRVVSAFERRSDWDLVLGLGGKLDPAELGPLPKNVVALAYAPQMRVLAEADCMITHGGITSINECVCNRVPMVVYSTRHGDQDGCAARVVYHRLGVMGDKDRDDDRAIEALVERVLGDDTVSDALAAMKACFEHYDTEGTAVAILERFLRGELEAFA
jgi:UDP:flavonoid glycosyltransferase YjiC (YdhE family)